MEIVQLALGKIKPSPDNGGARVTDIDSLAKSIKAVGLLNPIHVTDGGLSGAYEIVAGHRRFAAAKKAGLKQIDAVILDITDDKITTVRLTENMHRKQLTPFEEADAIEILEEAGRSPEEIAADLAMTPQAVARRRQLNKLTKEWKDYATHIREGHEFSVAAFELIASYEPSIQGKLLSEYKKSSHVPTVGDVKRKLSEFDRQLKSAPWKLDDATLLPAAGACSACPKRSSCQPLLFDGETDSKKAAATDKCLDIACWDNKLRRHGKKKLEEAKAKYPNLVVLKDQTWGAGRVVPGLSRGERIIVDRNYAREFEPAKKSDKDAIPAIKINEKGLGSIRYIKLTKKGEEKKAAKTPVKKLTPAEQAKQEAAELASRRNAWVTDKVNHMIGENSVTPDYISKMTPSDVILLLGKFVECGNQNSVKGLEDWRKLTPAEALNHLYGHATNFWLDNYNEAFIIAEQLLGIKRSDLEAQALEAIPDPTPKAGAAESKTKSTKKRAKKGGKK